MVSKLTYGNAMQVGWPLVVKPFYYGFLWLPSCSNIWLCYGASLGYGSYVMATTGFDFCASLGYGLYVMATTGFDFCASFEQPLV